MAALLSCAAQASVLDSVTPAPGRMGPNALPVPAVWHPAADSDIVATIAAEGYYDPRGDITANPFLRITFPLGGIAEAAIFSRPVEYFLTSESMRHERGARDVSGFSKGDLYFQTLIQILSEKGACFDAGCSYTLKTTTGKNLENARHLDAPAYFFDCALGKSVRCSPGLFLRMTGVLSFIAWQTAVAQQNDAVGYGIKASLGINTAWRFAIEGAGYCGWRGNGDRPAVLRIEARRAFGKKTEAFGLAQLGVRDQPLYSIRIGACVRVPVSARKSR